MESSKYNSSIDYLKGIAAVFVVIGHAITYLHNYIEDVPVFGQIVGNVVSAVHVPLFILISGYLCHRQKKKEYLIKKAFRVLIPFLVFSTLKFIYEIVAIRDSLTIRSFLLKIYDIFLIGNAYWFVYCILLIYIIAMLFWSDKRKKLILPVAAVLVFLNSAAALAEIKMFPECIIIGGTALETPFFQIERVLQYLPYFLLGMWLQDQLFFRVLDKHKIIFGACSLLAVSLCTFLVVKGISNKNYFVKLIMAIGEMILLRYLVRCSKFRSKVLKQIGLYSFQVMLFDGFYRVLLFALISKIICPNLLLSLCISAAVVALAVLSCCAARRSKVFSCCIGIQFRGHFEEDMRMEKSLFDHLVLSLNNHGFLNWMGDKANIRLVYKAQLGKKLDLENPKTFNEKMQWMKLYDRNPLYCKLVDKYDVREYVKDMIGEEHLIPVYGVWNCFSEIDFSKLPNQFVLKCTHDSGGVWICKDKSKADFRYEERFFKKRLKRGGFSYGREWPYKNLKPRLIAEKLMIDREADDLLDYKIHCFGGKAHCILVCSERHNSGLKEDWFTTEWEHLPIRRPTHHNSKKGIAKPDELESMIRLAEKLAHGLRFARIDLYLVDGKIYFGEITFFPTSGYTRFVPDEYDRILGELIQLG